MSKVFHRDPSAALPVAARGEGAYIIDREGARYLDAAGGAAVSCLGHDHPEVIAAIKAQLDRIPFAHMGFFTTDAMETLAEALVGGAPAGLERVCFASGGSEAVETALKLARQYFVEIGEPARRRFIARRQSYHGTTLGALTLADSAGRRGPFEPLLAEAHHIAPCYAYRGQGAGETVEAYGQRVADELDAAIQALGPETVAAFVAEPIAGASLGAALPTPGYFGRLREICDRYGVLLILDEVMCGAGRTGTYFACEQENVAPDLLVMAKGLGAGYLPIGAVLAAGRIYDAILAGSGTFKHAYTFMGHTSACAAALAVHRVIHEQDLLANVRARGRALADGLRARFAQHPHVGDVRGRGLLWGVELVADRDTKAPFDPARKLHGRIKRLAFERGLLCYTRGGAADGKAGDHVLLAPPFIIGETEVTRIVERLGEAIDEAISQSDG